MAAPYTIETVKKAYIQFGSLKETCAETGCPPYIAYIWLQKAKILKTDDSIRYGSEASKLGALAEAEFKKLVPDALPVNEQLQQNYPSYDFDIYGITVDIKFRSAHSRGNWTFKTAKGKPLAPDFYLCFCTKGKGLQDGYRCFLIPGGMVEQLTHVQINPDKPTWAWDYEVDPQELSIIFKQMKENYK